ncbi:hypothetical protein LZ496_03220 [Sphingomonas sp. NSE70-1]|uniref:Type II secretory pathway, component PulK n=1 Tax=Sphingomonas caseinilyticus TaxID=2908205 RepID=A0ABT0RS56_9SPHN|nr:hypothetical protein [Sphingomonas caseinilyticus]MCL6697796.1 hypothetical protein [Sphingomonas caseinilyticus]
MLGLRQLTDDQKKNVRHWGMEFVVVVIGVLLALWLQQWGERQQELADMHAAEDAIHDELRAALSSLMWREAISQCHIDRAKLLQSKIAAGSNSWPGLNENALALQMEGIMTSSVAPSVYQRPVEPLTNAAWTSALATGALGPMDRERFAKLVGLYAQVDLMRAARDREDVAAAALSPLGNPLTLTPELKAHMLEAIYQVDRSRFTFGLVNSRDFAAEMKSLGWDDTSQMDRLIEEEVKDTAAEGFKWRPCVAPVRNPFKPV